MHDISSNKDSLLSKQRGFTLIELLISIAVLTILLVLTVPSFRDMLMNNRVSAQTDALSNALSYARNTALNRNIDVLVCPIAAPGSTTCGANWQNGWIIVSQPVSGTATLLQEKSIGVNDPILSATIPSVTFDARGTSTTQGNFKVCDSRGGSFAQSVQVLPTGFIQSGSTMGTAVWNGSSLTCP